MIKNLALRAFAVSAALTPAFAVAQIVPVAPVELPKVIFCSGQCFAVDDKGVRIPVNKGSVLREGQRLETAAGAYAQVKLGGAAEVALSERGQIRFDQRSVGGRDLVLLDQGRLRMIGGEAMGKTTTRTLELRTNDGSFGLRGADVEVKKAGGGVSNPTLMKVNAGVANLGGVVVPRDTVHGIANGKVITDKTFSLGEVALNVRNARADGRGLPAVPPVALPPDAKVPTVGPISTTVLTPISMPPITLAPTTTTYTVKSTDLYVAPLTTTYTTSPTLFTQPILLTTTDTKATTTTTTTTTAPTNTFVLKSPTTAAVLRCLSC